MMQNKLQKIMIVGGGAAGLELATQLRQQLHPEQAHICLIDAKPIHVWKPLFHQIASGLRDSTTEAIHYADHAAQHGYQFICAEFTALQAPNKTIQLRQHEADAGQVFELAYDVLILALGSVTHDLGVPGVTQYAHCLDTLDHALALQHSLHSLLQNTTSLAVQIAIIGAGATGVELAVALSQLGSQSRPDAQLKISLIEAASRILPNLSAKTAAYASTWLAEAGIKIHTNEYVKAVAAHHLELQDQPALAVDLVIWTAGIQAPPVLRQCRDLAQDALGRIRVNSSLQSLSHPDIFALGDCAAFQVDNQHTLPPRAQVASQQARFLAKTLPAFLQGDRLASFKFLDKGTVLSFSAQHALAELLGQMTVQGRVAQSMAQALYPLHQVAIQGYIKTGLRNTQKFLRKKWGITQK